MEYLLALWGALDAGWLLYNRNFTRCRYIVSMCFQTALYAHTGWRLLVIPIIATIVALLTTRSEYL